MCRLKHSACAHLLQQPLEVNVATQCSRRPEGPRQGRVTRQRRPLCHETPPSKGQGRLSPSLPGPAGSQAGREAWAGGHTPRLLEVLPTQENTHLRTMSLSESFLSFQQSGPLGKLGRSPWQLPWRGDTHLDLPGDSTDLTSSAFLSGPLCSQPSLRMSPRNTD